MGWFDQHDAGDLFLSAVTEAELLTGVAILPEGQRRDRLWLALDAMIDQDFHARVLPFDSPAAKAYADIAARRHVSGHPIAEAVARLLPSLGRTAPLSPHETSRISLAAAWA